MTPRTCPPCDGLCSQGRRCPYQHQFLVEAREQQEGLTAGEKIFTGIVVGLAALLAIALMATLWGILG